MKKSLSILFLFITSILFSQDFSMDMVKNMQPRNIGPGGMSGRVTTIDVVTSNPDIMYATQSGPMLVINNNIHPVFVKGSKNLHVRNGVGVLPDGKLLFAMSKDVITLYDFAEFFKSHGCKNALYLDGFVSRTYLPKEKWEQLDGNFGVIIGETIHLN